MNWPAIRSAIEQIHLYLTNFQTQFSRKCIIKKNVIPFFELPFLFFFFFCAQNLFPLDIRYAVYARIQELVGFSEKGMKYLITASRRVLAIY